MSLFDENTQEGADTSKTPETPPTTPVAEEPKVETKAEMKARLKADKDAQDALEAEARAELEAEDKAAKAKSAPKVELSGVRYVEGKKPDKSLFKSDKDMRDYLMSFPKVMVMVPLSPGEKPGSTEAVLVNGIRLNIMKGSMVEVPKPFADQIFNHYNIGQLDGMLGNESRIDGNMAKETALN
jgi:hypothetical protein